LSMVMRKKLQDTFRARETVSEPCSKSCLIATGKISGQTGNAPHRALKQNVNVVPRAVKNKLDDVALKFYPQIH